MKTILLVDDELYLLGALGAILRELGYKVISRFDAASALAIIREGKTIDLVLTDYRMPGMSTDEFMAKLKQLLPTTPIIVLTGYSSVEMYIKTLSLGAFECLTKPVKVKDLDRALKSALEPSNAGDEALLPDADACSTRSETAVR